MNSIKFTFDKKLKSKEFSSKYFINTQKIFKKLNLGKNVTLRFFHFSDESMIAGINEVIQLLKFTIGKEKFSNIKIWYVNEGTIVKKEEPVLIVEGDYQLFGHLENIIDSILSRRSSIANNCHKIIKILGSEKVYFMGDRSDDYILQKYDGYAAYIGGIRHFCTKQHIELIKHKSDINYSGTIPHALIQQFNGNLNNALIAYKNIIGSNPIVALVDYNNDCIEEIKKLSKLDFNIDFIRIDTSSKLIDKSLQKNNSKNKNELFGVNHKLISLCRKELDKQNMKQTKIIATSGMNLSKIKEYQKLKTPIDLYGVGKSLLEINVHFTGDLIKTNNIYQSKKGRDNNIDNSIKKMIEYIHD